MRVYTYARYSTELDALGQIDGLKDALARLRKFGGRCVLDFQSIGASRLVGKREVIRRDVSHNRPTRFVGAAHQTQSTSVR